MEREPHEVIGVSRFAAWAGVRSAYRALARRYHPDGSEPDDSLMSAVNAAYEALERRYRTSDRLPPVPMGPGSVPNGGSHGGAMPAGPPSGSLPAGPPPGSLLWRMRQAHRAESPVLDFGQYAGWRIADVADHDPRYLIWLSRHSSGVRYRRAIEHVLGSYAELGRPAAVIGSQ